MLLDRLSAPHNDKSKNMLTKVSMALINNPTPDTVRLSKGCFDQHCAPEMLDAVKAINSLLDGDKLPDGTQNAEISARRFHSKEIFLPGVDYEC